jgi:tRNA pseudouridine55 synthase
MHKERSVSGRPANSSKTAPEGQTASSGFLLVDKPEGPTSFDVVAKLRRVTGIKKIGHAGTLDPLASGLLIVAVGREATRELSHFVGLPKRYEAVVRLGAESATDDREGPITPASTKEPKLADVNAALQEFIGAQEQTPPQFSAVKVDGQKAYNTARRGGNTELKPRKIEIYSLLLTDYSYPLLKLTVNCSTGTYIRSLARDLGKALGTGAYLDGLRRTAIGEYSVDTATSIDSFDSAMDWTKNLFNKNSAG